MTVPVMTIPKLATFITLCLISQVCCSAALAKQKSAQHQSKIANAETRKIAPRQAFKMQSDTLRKLMLQLYECNPKDLHKSTKVSAEELVQWVFEGPFGWKFEAIKQAQSVNAISLSFDENYQGDRVLSLITGLHTMLVKAYGGENEFKFTKRISPENLQLAIQNIEVTKFKLLNTSNHADPINTDCSNNQIKEIENTLTNTIKQMHQHLLTLGHDGSTIENTRENISAVDLQSAELTELHD